MTEGELAGEKVRVMLGMWDSEPFYAGRAGEPLRVWRAGMTSLTMFKRITLVPLWRIDSRRARGPEERPVRRLLQQFSWDMVEAGGWEEVVVVVVKSGLFSGFVLKVELTAFVHGLDVQ